MAHKQHVSKKQNVEINNSASTHRPRKVHVSFPWPPLEATLSDFNVTLFSKKFFLRTKK